MEGISKMQISVNNVCKTFGDKKVLEGISLSCESGKALGLLGRNGAGKTTTIRIIMGIFPADSGEVLLDGKSINRSKLKIGYLPEERGLYPKKIIMEQLVYLAELRGLKASEAKKSAKELLEKLGMSEYENKKLDTLSKGNQQKIQLIATLTCDPDIVILDEPFSGLDPVNAMLLKDTVKELIAKGKIVIFSSHQMNYVEEFCNDVAIMNNGKIARAGEIAKIKKSYERNKIVLDSANLDRVKLFLDSKMQEIVQNTHIEKTGLIVELRNAEMKNKLMSSLADESFDIDKFYVYEPSLSDIFVEYTENSERGLV
jgi:ABC-2 type transport system ATP-binding protein